MREMKDSGVSWIGQIPKDWKISRIKFVSKTGSGTTPKSDNMEYYSENGISWIQSGDLYNSFSLQQTEKKVTNKALKENPALKKYHHDFVVIAMYGASVGNIAISKIDACVNQACCVVLPHEDIYLNYLFYWLLVCKEDLINQAKGCGQPNISQNIINEEIYLQPPFIEQVRIVSYLDEYCSKIDEAISKHKTIIEKLEEYRKAVITNAVTKGLNSNVEMKDSGVSWIGKIPKDWKIKPLKYFFSFGKGLSITKADLIDSGLPVISYGQIHSKHNLGTNITDDLIRFVAKEYQEHSESKVPYGGFIFADTSEDLAGCGNCVYNNKITPIFAGYHTIVLSPHFNSDNKYFAYLFKTDIWRYQIRQQLIDVKVFSVSQKVLSKIDVIVPLPTQQLSIVSYLDKQCSKIDEVISKHKTIIEKLEKYRKSLIFNAITGKIDCKEFL